MKMVKIPKDFFKGLKYKIKVKPTGHNMCYCRDCVTRRMAEREYARKYAYKKSYKTEKVGWLGVWCLVGYVVLVFLVLLAQ